jgi:hypothetical protein
MVGRRFVLPGSTHYRQEVSCPNYAQDAHELGQNFLTDVGVIDCTDLVRDISGPLINPSVREGNSK